MAQYLLFFLLSIFVVIFFPTLVSQFITSKLAFKYKNKSFLSFIFKLGGIYTIILFPMLFIVTSLFYIWVIIFVTVLINIFVLTLIYRKNIFLVKTYSIIAMVFFGSIFVINFFSKNTFLFFWIIYNSATYFLLGILIYINEKTLPNSTKIISMNTEKQISLSHELYLPGIAKILHKLSKKISENWNSFKEIIKLYGLTIIIITAFITITYDNILKEQFFSDDPFPSVNKIVLYALFFIIISEIMQFVHEWGHMIPIRAYDFLCGFKMNVSSNTSVEATCLVPSGQMTPKKRMDVAVMGQLWLGNLFSPVVFIFLLSRLFALPSFLQIGSYLILTILFIHTLFFAVLSPIDKNSDITKYRSEKKLKKEIESINKYFRPMIVLDYEKKNENQKTFIYGRFGVKFEINQIGEFIIEECDGKNNIHDISKKIEEYTEGISYQKILDDTLKFIKELAEKKLLLNFEEKG